MNSSNNISESNHTDITDESNESNGMDSTSAYNFFQNPLYLNSLSESFRFSLRLSLGIVLLSIIGMIIGQLLRNDPTVGVVFAALAIMSLLMFFIGFISLLRDIQLSTLTKVKYEFVLDEKGIIVYQIQNGSIKTPVSSYPFNAITDIKVVSISSFIKRKLNVAIWKFSKKSLNISAVFIKFRIDRHLLNIKSQGHLLFELPAGTTLLLVENPEFFIKSLKKRRIHKKIQ
ncbi:MAG: hypothetical protein ACFFD1_05615 [Candidatus Thorarchaeota archaeon]